MLCPSNQSNGGGCTQGKPFKQHGNAAIDAAKAITKSSSKWLPIRRNAISDLHGKMGDNYTICTVGDTRWNSLQGCLASQLRVQEACCVFVACYKRNDKFPAALRVWDVDSFWHNIEEAELLIRPFCDASYLLWRTSNTMAHVFLVFLNLAKHVIEYCGESTAELNEYMIDL